MYDAQLGRFHTVDPMAELTNSITPYHYCLNNPIKFIDPTGMITVQGMIDEAWRKTPDGTNATYGNSSNDGGSEGDDDPPTDQKKSINDYPDWQVTLAKFFLQLDKSVNFWSDFLGGPTGEDVSTIEKIDYQVKIYASGQMFMLLRRAGALSLAKRQAKIPKSQNPISVKKVPMTDINGKTILNSSGKPIMTTEYTYKNTEGNIIIIQDHAAGHNYGGTGDQGSHFNVRPEENTRTGKVEGTESHYPYKK